MKRYTRLNFGTTSSSEIFQNAIQQVIQGIKGCRNISDDIIIFGATQEEHDSALEAVLQRFGERNLTLNRSKCLFNKTTLEFFGSVFSPEGTSPDPKKVSALKEAKPPANASECRSFLCMAQYCSRYIPGFATVAASLWELTKPKAKWTWTDEHQACFDKLKELLSSDTVLAYFDPELKSCIVVDASPVGLGAIFTQETRKGNRNVVCYASRTLTPVERRYSQIEREGLAIAWACDKFHLYLYGGPEFDIITDHKPLVPMFNNPRAQLPPPPVSSDGV